MIYLIAYSFLVLFVFLFALMFLIYTLFGIVANLMGSPYVPTKQKEAEIILKQAGLQKGDLFIELGSGDGRVVRTAALKYCVRGLGVEIHPLLLWYAKILAKLQKLTTVSFRRENFFKTNLSRADVIFVFLMPKTLTRLKEKFMNECAKNTLIISHGFKIDGWEAYLQKTIDHKPFPTYFYRIKT